MNVVVRPRARPRDGLRGILAAMLSVALASLSISPSIWLIPLFIPFSALILGFHWLGHMLAARSMGVRTEFRLWLPGLFITALFSPSPIKAILPGDLVQEGARNLEEAGIIALSGPASGAILSAFLLQAGVPFWIFDTIHMARLSLLTSLLYMIPVEPLDGYLVRLWSENIWLVVSVGLIFALIWTWV